MVEAERRTRRTVTVLFVDLVGSTELGEALDPEVLRTLQGRYFERAQAVVERHGGVVEKFIGDAVMAVFGWPSAHEDDALRAVRAAVEIRDGLASVAGDVPAQLELRSGVHTGPVVASDDATSDVLVTGDTVNTAARLQAVAGVGEILLGPVTQRLVRDAVEVEARSVDLRGKAEPLDAFRLVRLVHGDARLRALDTPLVGRAAELDNLESAFRRAVEEATPRLATILAPAGTGKSRLVREFVARHTGGASVLVGRCLSYGDGVTYWPLIEMLRQLVEADTDTEVPLEVARERLKSMLGVREDVPRVAGVLAALLGTATVVGSPDDIAWAVRRLFESLGQTQPLVVVVEDLHWAEPALLDLIETVLDWSRASMVMVLGTARPELLDQRPGWASQRTSATTIRLEPLDAGTSERLLDLLPGGAALPADLRGRIADSAEGNALFLEEMVGKLVDDGSIVRGDDGWRLVIAPERIDVPESIDALLGARIDGLPTAERRLAERGAVVGRSFERGAVAALSSADELDGLMGRLLALTRRDILHPDGLGLRDDEAFRFRHILIRDAAYERLSKAERAELHARLADWLRGAAGERLAEFAEIVAHHLAGSAELRRELGNLDDATRQGAVDALFAAATRAEDLHAYLPATRHLLRARSLIGRTDPTTAEEMGLTLRAAHDASAGGEVEQADQLIAELLERPEIRSDPMRAAELLTARALSWSHERDFDEIIGQLREAAEMAGPSASRVRAGALAALARALMLSFRFAESAAAAKEAVEVARSVRARSEESIAMNALGTSLGQLGDLEEGVSALKESQRIAEEAGDDIALTRAINNLAVLLSDAGRWDEARIVTEEGLALAERCGLSRQIGASMLWGRAVDLMLSGEPAEALILTDRVIALDPRPADAVVTACIRSAILTRLGRPAEAAAGLEAVRTIVERLDLPWVTNRYVWSLGRMARDDRRLDDVRPNVALGLNTSDDASAERIQILALAVGAEADRAAIARQRGDDAVVEEAASYLTPLLAEAGRLADAQPFLDVYRTIDAEVLFAEVERFHGSDTAERWEAVANRADSLGLRQPETYAVWRAAEAAVRAGAPPHRLRELLRRCDELCGRFTNEPIRRRIEELSRQSGIDLAAG